MGANGISYSTHKEYLEKFGMVFHDSVKKLIDKNAMKKYFEDTLNQEEKNLFSEIHSHAQFTVKQVQKFHGQNELIQKVYDKPFYFIF